MKIKGIREPNKKEKREIIPKLIMFGTTSALVAAVLYLSFFNYDIGESMYMKENFLTMRTVATHNLAVKIFEAIFKRDYMLSKLEGLSVAGLLSVLTNACIMRS